MENQELKPLTTEELYEIDGGVTNSQMAACAISATEVGVSLFLGAVPGVIFGWQGLL